jgi:hypothetical protein
MRSSSRLVPSVLCIPFFAVAVVASSPRQVSRAAHGEISSAPSSSAVAPAEAVPAFELPPLPSGVTELKFRDLFRQPVGPRGLELSDQVRGLDGQRVRILGYMVEESQPAARRLMLCSMPIKLHEDEWGFCEDLPAAVLYIFVDPSAPETVPFTPGPLLLTGTLSVGTRLETDQRVSVVRLQLDAPLAPASSTSARAGTH